MKYLLLALSSLVLGACIGTDFIDDSVPRVLRIQQLPDTIAFGDTVDLRAVYFDEVGRETAAETTWASADPGVFRVTDGARGIAVATGTTLLTAEVIADGVSVVDELTVNVGRQTVVAPPTSRKGTIRSTSSYPLGGSFTVIPVGEDMLIEVADDYSASTALPGMYLYLTNNPNTTAGALEVARVSTFQGKHSYLVKDVMPSDFSYLLYFCKPFNVKVGDGEIKEN